MKLVVCGKSEEGRVIGLASAAGYSVFSTRHGDAISPGDILSNPVWDDEDGVRPVVRNLTNGKEFPVLLEGWSLTLDEARKMVTETLAWHPPWPGTA